MFIEYILPKPVRAKFDRTFRPEMVRQQANHAPTTLSASQEATLAKARENAKEQKARRLAAEAGRQISASAASPTPTPAPAPTSTPKADTGAFRELCARLFAPRQASAKGETSDTPTVADFEARGVDPGTARIAAGIKLRKRPTAPAEVAPAEVEREPTPTAAEFEKRGVKPGTARIAAGIKLRKREG